MRRGKKIFLETLDRWREQGRGEGTGSSYQPWHQVRRSDPASRGRSHVIRSGISGGRQHHLLSDAEVLGDMCVWRLPNPHDVLEQFPLSQGFAQSVLARYSDEYGETWQPGTRALSDELGFQHPRVICKESGTGDWVMSTDLCAVLVREWGFDPIALAVKSDMALNDRDKEKLKIEERYWRVRGHRWYLLNAALIRPSEYHAALRIAKYIIPYSPPNPAERREMAEALLRLRPRRLQQAFLQIERAIGCDLSVAQARFWQLVWMGDYCIDVVRNAPRGLIAPTSVQLGSGWDPLLAEASR